MKIILVTVLVLAILGGASAAAFAHNITDICDQVIGALYTLQGGRQGARKPPPRAWPNSEFGKGYSGGGCGGGGGGGW